MHACTPQHHPPRRTHTPHFSRQTEVHTQLNWRGTFVHANIPRLSSTHTFTPLHIQTHTQTLEHRCRHTDIQAPLSCDKHLHTRHTHASTSSLGPNFLEISGDSDPLCQGVWCLFGEETKETRELFFFFSSFFGVAIFFLGFVLLLFLF